MKSEEVISNKLETTINNLTLSIDTLTAEEKENSCPPEKRCEIALMVGMLLSLGWVLDCEKEMQPFVNAMKFANLANKIENLK